MTLQKKKEKKIVVFVFNYSYQLYHQDYVHHSIRNGFIIVLKVVNQSATLAPQNKYLGSVKRTLLMLSLIKL